MDTEETVDTITPKNVLLTAYYKRSFAYYSVKHREPAILTQIIETLIQNEEEIINQFGPDSKRQLKEVIEEIQNLKYEIETDKPLRKLESPAADVVHYNNYIDACSSEKPATHISAVWLLTECYMYRRLKEAFELKSSLKDFDYFKFSKELSYHTNLELMAGLGSYFLDLVNSSEAVKTGFISLLKINLWGNKCDLSISLGEVEGHFNLFDTTLLEPNILSDHSERVWEAASANSAGKNCIDIIFDNAGYELFTDLCLADFLISKGLAKSIRFYVKTIPWFISDVMKHDFYWFLNQLANSDDNSLKELAKRWNQYVTDGVWTIIESDFWTLAYHYTYMKSLYPNLYKTIAESKLVIFKGDLNYRKLFGEKSWDPKTSVDEGLQGFHPTKLCTLRTIKAHIVCGLKEGLAEELDEKYPKWKEAGDYGLIQFSDKVIRLE